MESNSTGRWFCTASYMFVKQAHAKEQGLAGNTIVWGLQSWTHDVPISGERPGVKHSQGIKGFFHVLAKLLEAIHSKDLFSNILHLHTSCMKFFPKSRRKKNTQHPAALDSRQKATSTDIKPVHPFAPAIHPSPVVAAKGLFLKQGASKLFPSMNKKLLTLLPSGKHGNEK